MPRRTASRVAMSQEFGRWFVFGPADKDSYGHRRWRCLCTCGVLKDVAEQCLVTRQSRSCGCLQSEEIRQRATVHGGYASSLYKSWRSIRSRCGRRLHYKDVRMCERWNSFINFRTDILDEIGPRPFGTSIDRIDNTKGYVPGNVRWSTPTQQSRNRRCVKQVSIGDRSVAVVVLADELEISARTLHARLERGWSIDRVITTPLRGHL